MSENSVLNGLEVNKGGSAGFVCELVTGCISTGFWGYGIW